MATIVCQGLQSCLESQLLEPRTLRLKLTSPKPHFSQPPGLPMNSFLFDSQESCKKPTSNPEMGGWSFLQSLSNCTQNHKQAMDTPNTYVHPLSKRSSSTLSDKSLEICTENLGSETGTEVIDNSIFSLSLSESRSEKSPTSEQKQKCQLLRAKKATCHNFPPPLTTISGSDCLQVRPQREDGRLVIKAFMGPSRHNLFHAERSNGRLRLSFFKDSDSRFDSDEVGNEENEAKSECEREEEIENDGNCEESRDQEEDFEAEEREGNCMGENMDGISLEVGGEMGREKFGRPSRCKEGDREKNNGLLNWEPFWVATS